MRKIRKISHRELKNVWRWALRDPSHSQGVPSHGCPIAVCGMMARFMGSEPMGDAEDSSSHSLFSIFAVHAFAWLRACDGRVILQYQKSV